VYRFDPPDIRHFFPGFPASRQSRAYGTVNAITKLILALVFVARTAPISAQDRTTGTVQGVVVDARTGSPLPKILIVVEGGHRQKRIPRGSSVSPT
jgi:hypothetical protein